MSVKATKGPLGARTFSARQSLNGKLYGQKRANTGIGKANKRLSYANTLLFQLKSKPLKPKKPLRGMQNAPLDQYRATLNRPMALPEQHMTLSGRWSVLTGR